MIILLGYSLKKKNQTDVFFQSELKRIGRIVVIENRENQEGGEGEEMGER